jgi:hypothetical protein
MARPRIAADKSAGLKKGVAQAKDVGAKLTTGPNVSKSGKAVSSRIIKANKSDQLGMDRKKGK